MILPGGEGNGFGSQAHSQGLTIELEPDGRTSQELFIRAPRFVEVGPKARVVARLGAEPVALEAPRLLATSFHPELGEGLEFHRRFLAGAGDG